MPAAQIFLIDTHALCYRSFYAIKGLSNSRGQATNAVFGVINTLKKISKEFSPQYCAACFDSKGKTHRHEKFAEYKIQRPSMPDELISQIPIIKKVISAYHIPILEKAGFEADDLIGTLARKFAQKGIEVVIVSDDKDMFQLVNEHIKVYSSRRDQVLDAQNVEEILGFPPDHVTDFIALAGDPSDNIPGVAGIGDVSARKLIGQYGSLENILKNIDEIKPQRLQGLLREDRQSALLSKELAGMVTDIPLDVTLPDLQVKEPDTEQLRALFNELEFRKLAAELPASRAESSAAVVRKIDGRKGLEPFLARIRDEKIMAFAFRGPAEEMSTISQNKAVVGLKGGEVLGLDEEQAAALKDILGDEAIIKITWDIKNQLKNAGPLGIDIRGNIFDVMLANYLLAPSRNSDHIGLVIWEYLKAVVAENPEIEMTVPYLFKLYDVIDPQLQAKDLKKLFEEIEIPLARVLSLMEEDGVLVDKKVLAKLSVAGDERIRGLMKDLFHLAGEEFNLNSPKQLCHILFEKLKLPVVKKTKTGFSTDEEVLARLASQHPLPAMILEYRQIAKLKSTYIDALPKMVNHRTGRIHGIFNQVGTETGRLSSSNPNLQNIPIRTELGRQIRQAFIPSKGNVIIAADYSQIELRILAHLSKDPTLINAFQQGQDIHRFTASLIFDVPLEAVTDEMRSSVKRVNFGIIYGMSAFGLARDLNISQREAQDFIDRYFVRYPRVREFMDEQIRLCEEKGFVVTLLNRRRYIPEIHSSNMAVRQFAQRQAINTPVQGSAADLMKLAMIEAHREMESKKLKSRMIITVHDEIVFDVPRSEEKVLTALAREKMEHTLALDVPIKVTIKKGPNWLELERVSE